METLPTILKQTASLLSNILDVPRVLHETTNLTSQMLFIYIMTQKTLYICSELLLTLANFQNSFTVILSMKLQQNKCHISHQTLNVLLQYLAKFKI